MQLVVGGETGPGRASGDTRNPPAGSRKSWRRPRAWELLTSAHMPDADFSLPIVVVLSDRRVVAEDQLPTLPFKRANLPGVDLRPAQERPSLAAPPARTPVAANAAEPRPLPAPRHAWLPSPSHPVPSKVRARSLLGVPPPPAPRAAPLSDDEERRIQARVRAWRRIAWAQRMLERFQFADAQP